MKDGNCITRRKHQAPSLINPILNRQNLSVYAEETKGGTLGQLRRRQTLRWSKIYEHNFANGKHFAIPVTPEQHNNKTIRKRTKESGGEGDGQKTSWGERQGKERNKEGKSKEKFKKENGPNKIDLGGRRDKSVPGPSDGPSDLSIIVSPWLVDYVLGEANWKLILFPRL